MLTPMQIEALAKAMKQAESFTQYVHAGYTYLAQFIAHDIVPPTQGGGRVVRPCLQLDSLYGTSTRGTPLDERGLFPIGPSVPGGPHDLPRSEGVAQIPEPRNDENTIVSQLHLFWQRLHNFTLTSGCAADAAEARRLVTAVYQLIVVEDFLRQVLAPEVFCHYFHYGERWLDLEVSSIPPEFARAAFRFGHSMTRPAYEAFGRTQRPDVKLAELFRRDQGLEPDFEINWRGFFGWPAQDDPPQGAMSISVNVTPAMAELPGPTPGAAINIMRKNLEAGEQAGLLPGKLYAKKYKLTALKSLGELADPRRLHPEVGITIDHLPLWPYLLLEATSASHGWKLGVLGSAICAEVLANAVTTSQHSIYRHGHVPVDVVLEGLGALGRRIEVVRRANATSADRERTFCMRHVVELVLES
jgi:Animal haem peroxidase